MRLTQITMLAAAVFLGSAVSASAQPTLALPSYFVAFDHDGAQTDTYEVRVDDGAWAVVAVTAGAGDLKTTPLPAMTPGLHTVQVRGCGPLGCSDASAPAEVTLVVLMTPTNVQIIATLPGGD